MRMRFSNLLKLLLKFVDEFVFKTFYFFESLRNVSYCSGINV